MYHPILDFKKKKIFFPSSRITFNIVQVGVGGTGGYLVQRLSKMLHAFSQQEELNFKFRYTLIDGDQVEPKNLLRQPFIEEDIGSFKAQILADRYSNAYNIPIFHQNSYIDSKEQLIEALELFNHSYSYDISIPILLGCVDNNATRKIMHELFMHAYCFFYLDSGIDGVSGETEEEKSESGYSGQVVMGFKKGKIILDPVGFVYPNILEDEESKLPTEACGETVVNHPQRMQTNEMAALVMASYLNNLLGDLKIVSHYTNFNALTMNSKPTYLTQNQVHI